ncbi:MAG: hypothetical protein FJ119_01180 [Deltaproteobacteria bacterium]|nr:hypothetical protein [Deltaproteobacteria bacterium]
MKQVKEKSIGLAIALNLLLPGVGYMYMGKVIVGIGALLLVLGTFAARADYVLPAWIGINLIMAIDMLLLGKKNQKDVASKTLKKCPRCAEMVQKEAAVCRYCNTIF